MSDRPSNADIERTKRELRLRIGRQRRLIDGRLRSVRDRGTRLLSWRACVESFPGTAVVAALGAGLAISAGLKPHRLARWLGLRMVRRAADRAGRIAWHELEQIWADSSKS